jgi:hypothetical protein
MFSTFRNVALAAALVLAPLSVSAATSSGFFDAPVLNITADDFAQGSVTATARENFNNKTGTLTFAEDLLATISLTVNPYLNAVSGGGLSNSISVFYKLNAGTQTQIILTKVGSNGVATLENFALSNGDTLAFIISGAAGRSGNAVTVNVETFSAAVPLPAAGLLLIAALGGFAVVRRRN